VAAASLADVEVIVDYQLQVEHALDLVDRRRVIFVDAGVGTPSPFEFRWVVPAADFLHTSHALSPEAVLATYVRVQGKPPPECWLLCIRGERFGLGDDLTDEARERLEAATQALLNVIGLAAAA
jgi:hydrogenase maturation protease